MSTPSESDDDKSPIMKTREKLVEAAEKAGAYDLVDRINKATGPALARMTLFKKNPSMMRAILEEWNL